MKKVFFKSAMFGIVTALSLILWDCNHVVMAQPLNMLKSEKNIAMSYNVAGVKMATESEKEAMKIAKSVVENFFKALSNKQYRVAFDYFSPEIQDQFGYDRFVSNLSKTQHIGLLYCSVINYEGNLVAIGAETDELERLDNGKLNPRLFEYKLAVNKLQSGWKIVGIMSKDITLDRL